MLLVKPVVHKFPTGRAKGLGIRVREFTKKMKERQSQVQVTEAAVKAALEELGVQQKEKAPQIKFGNKNFSGKIVPAADIPEGLIDEIERGSKYLVFE